MAVRHHTYNQPLKAQEGDFNAYWFDFKKVFILYKRSDVSANGFYIAVIDIAIWIGSYFSVGHNPF